jgi:WD40 repeat protein
MADGKVRHWDLSSGRCLREFEIPERELWDDLPQGAPRMAVTPDGRRLLLSSDDGVAVHDLPSGLRTGAIAITRQPGPLAIHVTPDGKRLIAVSGSTGFLGSWDLETGAPAAGFAPGDTGPFQAFCASGPFIATAKGNILSLRDARTGRLLRTWDQKSYIDDILFALPQGEVVTAGHEGFHFWDREGRGTLIEKPINAMDVLTFGGCPGLLPGGEHLLIRGRFLIALWDVKAHRLLWRVDLAEQNKVRKLVPFPDGRRFAAPDSTGAVTVRSVGTGEVLATLHVLPQGFIWETPPDDHAPSGWLWTDREDLITVTARSGNDSGTTIFREGESEHRAYLRIYNNRAMVMAKIAGKEQYRQHVALHTRVLDRARIGNGSVGLRPALP